MRRHLLASTVVFVVSCSLTTLDGLSGKATAPPEVDGQAGPTDARPEDSDGGVARDASLGSPRDASLPLDCVNDLDRSCASFDDGPIDSRWTIDYAGGTIDVAATGKSPPNAASFVVLNAGGATVGPHLLRTFEGTWSEVDCRFSLALDEVPDNGGIDVATAQIAQTAANDVGLRIYKTGFALLSCLGGSNCKAEVNAGPLFTLGSWHDVELRLTRAGEYRFSLDGVLRGTTSVTGTLATESIVSVLFGAIYRPFGAGGSFRVREDDLVCTRKL